MTTDISDDLRCLRETLICLKATGPDGFEGLIGNALSKIADVPFRLARSGSQFGVDGKSAHSGAGICFECKRHTRQVRNSEIMEKIGELATGESDIDLWVLCVTSQVSSQIAHKALRFSETLFDLHSDSRLDRQRPSASGRRTGDGIRERE